MPIEGCRDVVKIRLIGHRNEDIRRSRCRIESTILEVDELGIVEYTLKMT